MKSEGNASSENCILPLLFFPEYFGQREFFYTKNCISVSMCIFLSFLCICVEIFFTPRVGWDVAHCLAHLIRSLHPCWPLSWFVQSVFELLSLKFATSRFIDPGSLFNISLCCIRVGPGTCLCTASPQNRTRWIQLFGTSFLVPTSGNARRARASLVSHSHICNPRFGALQRQRPSGTINQASQRRCDRFPGVIKVQESTKTPGFENSDL